VDGLLSECEVVGDVGPSLELLPIASRDGCTMRALLRPRESILSRITDRATEERWPPTPQRIVHDGDKSSCGRHRRAGKRDVQDLVLHETTAHYVANTLLLDNGLRTWVAGLPSQ